MDTMVVTAGSAPLFAEPRRDAEVADEVLFGMNVRVLERLEDGWLRVAAPYDYSGYIQERELWAAGDGGYEADVVVRNGFTGLLREPRYRKEPLRVLPRGAALRLVGPEGDRFMRVLLPDGGEAFVHKDHIAEKAVWDGDRSRAVEAAKTYLGAPYKWGGKTPAGIDCSGLCFMAYWLCGKEIYRDAHPLEKYMRTIPLEEAQPGDCIYFPGHVGMYLGAGKFIHSNSLRGGVTINSLRPEDPDFAPELVDKIQGVGTVL